MLSNHLKHCLEHFPNDFLTPRDLLDLADEAGLKEETELLHEFQEFYQTNDGRELQPGEIQNTEYVLEKI